MSSSSKMLSKQGVLMKSNFNSIKDEQGFVLDCVRPNTRLPKYDSLRDPHLLGYFYNKRIKSHLLRIGLITNDGYIVDQPNSGIKLPRKTKNPEEEKHLLLESQENHYENYETKKPAGKKKKVSGQKTNLPPINKSNPLAKSMPEDYFKHGTQSASKINKTKLAPMSKNELQSIFDKYKSKLGNQEEPPKTQKKDTELNENQEVGDSNQNENMVKSNNNEGELE